MMTSEFNFNNTNNLKFSIDLHNKQLFSIDIYNTYPFNPPAAWITTKYGEKNFNRWCGDITSIVNKRHYLSNTNILLAAFFSIDTNTRLYKGLTNIPITLPINCLCCTSILCPNKWNY